MTTATATATYRKTKTGEWVAYGPAATIVAGRSVQVAKRDGTTKTEQVSRVGRTFTVAGVEMVYGYLAPRTATPRYEESGRRYAQTGYSHYGDDNCWKCAKYGNFDGCDRCGADGDC